MDMETPIREADQRPGHRTAPVSEPPVANGLQVVSIAKSYDKRVVLTDVSVSVGRGEVIGLLGPNGAGKTTCFYSVMGLVKPDSGRIMLDGEDITRLPMYRRTRAAFRAGAGSHPAISAFVSALHTAVPPGLGSGA